MKTITDPIHGDIEFKTEDDKLILELINCREFQRLNHVKQQGLANYVFPGATQSRLAHSIGVFHMARRLLKIIQEQRPEEYNERRALASKCAALLHDTGHGPFSHAFERVMERRGAEKCHEEWTAEVITGDTEVRKILEKVSPDFPEEVAGIILAEEPEDIYGSIISSQFDADRLDYLQRDRHYSGIKEASFDLDNLLNHLTVTDIPHESLSHDDADNGKTSLGFVFNDNGMSAVEDYLLARYHVYVKIGFSRQVRAAEELLTIFFDSLSQIIDEDRLDEIGVTKMDPVVDYMRTDEPTLDQYMRLTDGSVMHLIDMAYNAAQMKAYEGTAPSEDPVEQMYMTSRRIKDRQLLRGTDIGAKLQECLDPDDKRSASDLLTLFTNEFEKQRDSLGFDENELLIEDDPKLTGYKWFEGSRCPLKRILIQKNDGGIVDVAKRSSVVKGLMHAEFYRMYTATPEGREIIRDFTDNFIKQHVTGKPDVKAEKKKSATPVQPK